MKIKKLKKVPDNVLTSFKNNNPIESFGKLIVTFNNSKYGILLANFHDYSILFLRV